MKVKSKYAPMVKRLRRRPLTAESGVRVPLGVPKKQTHKSCVFLLFLRESAYALEDL